MSSQVRRFFLDLAEQERQKKDPSAESAEKISKFLGAALRVQVNPGGFQGELLAVPLDMQGHTLVLGGIFKEAQQDPKNPAMKLIMPDGTQREADFVGANLYAGYSIIKLKDAKGIDPVRWSEHRLTAGEMLMPITSGQSFVPMVFVNQRIGEPFSEDRLQADEQGNSRFERNGAFLMDVHGNLAAIVTTGGGWAGERFAISATRMQRELKYILEQNKDIEPRPLGITFQVPVPATGSSAPGSMPGRRAVQVQEVTPGSLAANAGVMKDDIILSIDGRPISELVSGDRAALPGLIKLQVDLATRTDEVPLIITRKGVEQTLKMQLK
jgi:putative serine protease PepD